MANPSKRRHIVLGRDVNKLMVIEEAKERGLAVKRGTAGAVFG